MYYDIPKCASTAIKLSLGYTFANNSGEIGWTKGDKWRLKTHNRYYTFTFVRHPFDRVCSTFSMYKNRKTNEKDFEIFDYDPKDFIE